MLHSDVYLYQTNIIQSHALMCFVLVPELAISENGAIAEGYGTAREAFRIQCQPGGVADFGLGSSLVIF